MGDGDGAGDGLAVEAEAVDPALSVVVEVVDTKKAEGAVVLG